MSPALAALPKLAQQGQHMWLSLLTGTGWDGTFTNVLLLGAGGRVHVMGGTVSRGRLSREGSACL